MTTFDQLAFESALAARAIGRNFVYRREIDTTMELARDLAAKGAPHGALVLAERQTAGRGRRGRSFHSPDAENLYFTLVLRMEPERLPVALPVAVCRACAAEGVGARIKWPNDIWIGERKVAGMLIDAESAPEGSLALAGIGINVNGDPTLVPELREIATSLSRELKRPVPRELLLARICNEIEEMLAMGEGELIEAYRGLSLVLGRRVVLAFPSGETSEATATGIAADGSLTVRYDDGTSEAVNAADVSLRPADG
jgi:BirA family biotin operon repressor/biotin-[acetyl-CoA-carboxylase] ligase